MKTDKHLYSLFEANPQWIFELTGLTSPGKSEWKSVVLKSLEQHCDGVIFPEEPTGPITVVEFQFQEDSTIYNRIAREMSLLQEEHAMRDVQGVIFFRYPYLDPKTEPWRQVIRSYQLRDVVEGLAQQNNAHPLVAVFRPVLLTNEDTLEKNAALYYNQIKTSTLTESLKETLLEVFINWLELRLKHMGKKEIEKMLFGELTDLRETQSGKDLIEIGHNEGKIEGKQEDVMWILEARFGTLSPDVRQRIEQIKTGEKLKDLMMQALKVDSIEQLMW